MSAPIEEELYISLRTGLFKPRASDSRRAAEIAAGAIIFGEVSLPIRAETFVATNHETEPFYLALHTLRWVDQLLRADAKEYSSLWQRLVSEWWDLNQDLDPSTSRLWAFPVLAQRVQTLALGREFLGELDSKILEKHSATLIRRLGEASTPRSFRNAVDSLILLNAGRTDVMAELETALRLELKQFVRPSGGLYGRDLKEISVARETWEPWLNRLEARGFDLREISESLNADEFWSHLIGPNGDPVPLGNALPDEDFWLDFDGGISYLRTNGRVGNPPAFGFLAEEGGISSSRSGWGETERDLQNETHWSMWTGPARGRGAHADSGRVTYFSQGESWLIDPIGEEFAAPAHHSTVEIEQRRFRDNAKSRIIRSNSNALIDEVVVAPQTYLPAQWNRDLVFVKSNHRLVVKDTIRASTEVAGKVRWILHPDVTVTYQGQNIFCSKNGKTVCICLYGADDRTPVLDELTDASGSVVAKRLTAKFSGQSSRIVTVISDVIDEKKFSVTRKPAPGHWIIVDHEDKGINERLVNTIDGSILADPLSSVEQSIELAERRLAQGEISDSEALEQRVLTRRAIEKAKSEAWENPTAENRQRLIDDLAVFGDEHLVSGLRDHALGAAMVDLAGADITGLPKHAEEIARKRSNLLSWNQDEEQKFYRVPIVSTRTPDLTDSVRTVDDFVWSVDCGQIVPSALVRPKLGDTLLVYLHGATDRTRHSMPRYERVRSLSKVTQGPVAFFSDSTLDLDSRMILAWFIGHNEMNLHRVIAQMVDNIAERFGVERVAVVGNSGGGFSAMQVASYLQGASFVSINGQSDIGHYTPLLADQAAWAVFGKTEPDSFKSDELERWSVLRRFREIDFDIHGLVLQNSGDDHHLTEHYLPLKHFVEEHAGDRRIQFKQEFMGDGHVAPAPADYEKIVTSWINAERDNGSKYQGLRSC